MSRDLVFVYGSLIARAAASPGASRTELKGWQRAWNKRSRSSRMTAVGIVPAPEGSCGGILLPVDEEGLRDLDARETGYDKVRLSPKDFAPPGPAGLRLWTYRPRGTAPPSQDCPILLSYVDVILSGCLELGEAFAEEFVAATSGWDGPLEDDRDAPRYVRALTRVPARDVIDALLRRHGISA